MSISSLLRAKTVVMLLLIRVASAAAQPPTIREQMEDSLHKFKYVFEASVQHAEVFLGDNNGKPLDHPEVTWHDSIGDIKWGIGTGVSAYVGATLNVCEIYKGNLHNSVTPVTVKSRTTAFQEIWLEALANGDTVLRYSLPRYRNGWEEFKLLLPHPAFSDKRLFVVTRLTDVNDYDYSLAADCSNISCSIQIPLGKPGIPQTDPAYAFLFPHVFSTRDELTAFLHNLPTLKEEPGCRCE